METISSQANHGYDRYVSAASQAITNKLIFGILPKVCSCHTALISLFSSQVIFELDDLLGGRNLGKIEQIGYSYENIKLGN